MPINFPTSLDTLTNPASSDLMSSVTVPHATQHSDTNDAIEAIEAKIGINNSTVASSLDYITKSVSSLDPGHLHSKLRNTANTGNSLVSSSDGQLTTTSHLTVLGRVWAETPSGAITRNASGFISSINIGSFSATVTRDASGRISSVAKSRGAPIASFVTWTFTRNASDYITSWVAEE